MQNIRKLDYGKNFSRKSCAPDDKTRPNRLREHDCPFQVNTATIFTTASQRVYLRRETRHPLKMLAFHAVFSRCCTDIRCGIPWTLTAPPQLGLVLEVLYLRLPAHLQQSATTKVQAKNIPTARQAISASNGICLLSITAASQIACRSIMPSTLSSCGDFCPSETCGHVEVPSDAVDASAI